MDLVARLLFGSFGIIGVIFSCVSIYGWATKKMIEIHSLRNKYRCMNCENYFERYER